MLGGENDIRSSFRVWCCFCPWAFGIGSEFLMLAPSQENSTGTMGCQSCSWKSAWLSFCAFHAFFWLPQLTWVIRTSTSNSCQWLGQAIPRDSPCRSGINPLLWASSSAKPRRPVELGYIPVRACSFNFPVVLKKSKIQKGTPPPFSRGSFLAFFLFGGALGVASQPENGQLSSCFHVGRFLLPAPLGMNRLTQQKILAWTILYDIYIYVCFVEPLGIATCMEWH